jgi:2-aminoadipate transaminase
MCESGDSGVNSFGYAHRARRIGPQPISFLMAQGVTNPKAISLAAGLVDHETLPTEEVRELLAGLLADPNAGRAALQYGTTEGLGELRQLLLEHMAALDGLTPAELGATAEEVLITSGSQQLLFMLADILVDEGDIVITCWPSYFVYTGVLEGAGARVRCVEMDELGMVPESLERVLEDIDAAGEIDRVKIIYSISYHQNPTGLTLAEDRKPVILDLVRRYSRRHRILLLEDAAYRELTFEGAVPKSFRYFDRAGDHTAVLQTFSKPFSPGLRTGYGLLPRDLVEPIVLQKGNHDFGSTNFCQHLLLAAMKSGLYARHVELLRKRYAKKRDAMLRALEHHFSDPDFSQVSWTHPTGGLYVYLTLPDGIDAGREGPLFGRALEEGVLYVPGECCYPPDPTRKIPRNTLRLSFGVANEEQIGEAVGRLARAIRSLVSQAPA